MAFDTIARNEVGPAILKALEKLAQQKFGFILSHFERGHLSLLNVICLKTDE